MQSLRLNRRWAGGCAIAVCLASGSPGWASPQSISAATDRKVIEMLETAHAVYGVPDPRLKGRCQAASGDEIVVCADHGADQRIPSTAETDPDSLAARRALNGGIPRAPQFDRGYCASCKHFGSAPTPVYYIDVTKLPPPPPGSDADLIARGDQAAR